MKNRVVFDTNNWISCFIGNKTDEIVAMTEKDILFLHSKPSIEELKEVLLRKKFQKYNFDVEILLYFYTQISEFCQTTPQFKNCPDPKDNFLFDLALQGKANYLVSGDAKVLATKTESKTLKITTLKSFKEDVL
jgi:putative PIN family toxin of toxin-antitoxin system